MRVFVLCTGRCASTTFAYACNHMRNFSVGHETRAKFIGPERLDYPDNHIEIDNRLSWFMGRLDKAYGDDAHYVHLTRNPREVAESYARRMPNPASIGAGYKRAILMNGPHAELDVCVDAVETMLSNIELFLKGKTHVMHVALESVAEDFRRFWEWIGAEGDLDAALSEWETHYNDSEESLGAIHPEAPNTELADLRDRHKALTRQAKRANRELAETTERLEKMTRLERNSASGRDLAEKRVLELERRIASIETLWRAETDKLRREVSYTNRVIENLRTSATAVKEKFVARLSLITEERDAFVKYADDMRARYEIVVKSRTWKVLAPYRFAMSKAKALILRNPMPANILPVRPTIKPASKKKPAATVITTFDGKLWGGFSESALAELSAYKDDEDKPRRERAEAAYCLARWHSVKGDFERALEEVRAIHTLYPEQGDKPKALKPQALFLCRLGRPEEAREVLGSLMGEFDPSVQLMLANTFNPVVTGERTVEAEGKVLDELNVIYEHAGLIPLRKRIPQEPLSMDNLCGTDPGRSHFDADAKVTVIMPVFNAEETIVTAMRSVAEQTWQNLEVLVVDDVSTDRSIDLVTEFCAGDDRFRLIRQQENGGSYLCRNRALKEATGAFVTIHDSDDWSHPEKIRCQVEDMQANPGPYNLATWVRTTTSLAFFGNSRTLYDLVRPDHSSGLFPMETFRRFGAWDAVRISADTELFWRIECVLGNKKWMFNRRQVLKDCPLSFGRMSETSLTQTGATSVMTIFHGLRREYRDASDFWHSQLPELNDLEPWSRRRPFFPAPAEMRPMRSSVNKLSALLVADWNVAGEKLEAIVNALSGGDEEVDFGLLHYPLYDAEVGAPINHDLRRFAWDNGIKIVVPGETVEAELAVVITPRVFAHRLDLFPSVSYERLLVVDESSADKENEAALADLEGARKGIIESFGSDGEWVRDLRDYVGARKQTRDSESARARASKDTRVGTGVV